MGIWACGAIIVGLYWMTRWLRIHRAVRQAKPLPLVAPIPVKSAPGRLEPGVVGIFRPMLLLPEGICAHLSSRQLQMIVNHEMCHVRRRDNLTAAIHMLVEAVFWFHPLVWWMGRQMIVEREAACDEAVIGSGGDREAYAEGLLSVCKFYLESPLDCAAGVAGAELKSRIQRIMTPRFTQKLSSAKKALLATAATAVILAPIVMGSVLAAPARAAAQTEGMKGSSSQSVTIRASQPQANGPRINVGPGFFRVENYPLRTLIGFGFDVQGSLISGPKLLEARYNIKATSPGAFKSPGYGSIDQARTMVRTLLANRFHLKVHHTTRTRSVYVLTRNGPGSDMRVARPDEPGPLMYSRPASISGTALRMDDFIELLSKRLSHPVVDETGLNQTYNFTLSWKENSSAATGHNSKASAGKKPSPEELAEALKTQLGLTLQLQRKPVKILRVDHVQSPAGLLAARKAIPMNPHAFDKFVGYYKFPGNWIMTVSRKGDRFLTQLQGQPHVRVFPEAPNKFFAGVVDAQITFESNTQGKVTGLVLHQGGRDIHAPRMNEAKAKKYLDALETRIKNNIPQPGSEQALRQDILGLASGKPDYARMSPMLAKATREQLPILQKSLVSLGSLVSLKFTGVNPIGWDTYKAQFKHGAAKWSINMGADGKISGALVRRVP